MQLINVALRSPNHRTCFNFALEYQAFKRKTKTSCLTTQAYYLIFCVIDYHLGYVVTEVLDLAETTPNHKLYMPWPCFCCTVD